MTCEATGYIFRLFDCFVIIKKRVIKWREYNEITITKEGTVFKLLCRRGQRKDTVEERKGNSGAQQL